MRPVLSIVGMAGAITALWPACAPAADAKSASANAESAVAATVDEQPIQVSEVSRAVKAFVHGRPLPAAMLNSVIAQVLEQLIDRQVVLAHLQETGEGTTAADVDQALAQFKAKLAAQKVAFEELLKTQQTTEAELRRQAAWELSWKKFSDKHATDAALEEFFQANRKQFDGTEVAVSHILLRPERSGDPQGTAPLVEQAKRIRQQILAGKLAEADEAATRRDAKGLSFAEAARKYSQGPSAEHGGDLGFITRQGIMVEEFSRAAFALDLKEISEPVQTRFGVHLIQCTEIKPGKKSWTEVRGELAVPFAQSLFTRLAHDRRPKAKVQYTDLVPHFKPGSNRELVLPKEGG